MILSDYKVISAIVTNNKGTYDAVSHVIFLHIRNLAVFVVLIASKLLSTDCDRHKLLNSCLRLQRLTVAVAGGDNTVVV